MTTAWHDPADGTVRPFPAYVVHQEWAQTVVCPMSDALAPERRAKILAENPMSYLQVTRSHLDLPNASPEEIGEANAAGLRHLLAEDAYGELSPEALYIYRVHLGDEEHTGIVAELDVAAFVDGRVLGHEAVHAQRVAALVDHFAAVPMRSELVAVIHRNDDVVNAVVDKTTQRPPLLSFTDTTGVEQLVWPVDPDDAVTVMDALRLARFYIADGHHRVAATVQRWRDHGSPRGGGVLGVLYSEEQVHLLAFDRIVPVASQPDRDLLTALRRVGTVTEESGPTRKPGVIGVRWNQQWYSVQLPPVPGAEGAAALDVARLASEVWPALGLPGEATPQFVSEKVDPAVTQERVDAEGAVWFTLAAPTLAQLYDVAERGEVMPPKSTYIEPKPRAGLFVRPRLGPVLPEQLPDAEGGSH